MSSLGSGGSRSLSAPQGCLGAVHVGGLLLPYFSEAELFVGAAAQLLAAQPHYALLYVPPASSYFLHSSHAIHFWNCLYA